MTRLTCGACLGGRHARCQDRTVCACSVCARPRAGTTRRSEVAGTQQGNRRGVSIRRSPGQNTGRRPMTKTEADSIAADVLAIIESLRTPEGVA